MKVADLFPKRRPPAARVSPARAAGDWALYLAAVEGAASGAGFTANDSRRIALRDCGLGLYRRAFPSRSFDNAAPLEPEEIGLFKRDVWRDEFGNEYPVPAEGRRLDFSEPATAALRAFIFRRDRFACRHCGRKVYRIPEHYDGTHALHGWGRVLMVLDHVEAYCRGGGNGPGNLRVLCEQCNIRKGAGTI